MPSEVHIFSNLFLFSPESYLRRLDLGTFLLLAFYALLAFATLVFAASLMAGLAILNLLALPALPLLVVFFVAGSILICSRDPSSPTNPLRSQISLLVALPIYLGLAGWHLYGLIADPSYVPPEWFKPVIKLVAFIATSATLNILTWTGLRSFNDRTRSAARLLRKLYLYAFVSLGVGILFIVTYKPAGLLPMLLAVALLFAAFLVSLRLLWLIHGDMRRVRKLGVPAITHPDITNDPIPSSI